MRDPQTIANAYTADNIRRNQSAFLEVTAAIEWFLIHKWEEEKSYRLRKEPFAFTDDKIAAQFGVFENILASSSQFMTQV